MSTFYSREMVSQSPGKVSNQTDQLSKVYVNKRFPPTQTWARPSDWLPMPNIQGQQKAVILVEIDELGYNWVGFVASGNYTIDWGDGSSPVNLTSGTVTGKNISWSTISSSTLMSNGCRQAIVTIYPQSGQTLTSLDFDVRRNDTSFNQSSIIMEIAISGSNLTNLTITDKPNLRVTSHRALKKVALYGASSITDFSYMFAKCSSLREVHIDPEFTASATNMSFMFSETLLDTAPTMNVSAVTNAAFMFYATHTLRKTPDYNFSNCLNMASMFEECQLLDTLGNINSHAAQDTNKMFFDARSLPETTGINLHSSTNTASMFYSNFSLQSIKIINAPASINATSMFDYCLNLRNVHFINMPVSVTTSSAFHQCGSLEYVGTVNMPLAQTANHMFDQNDRLKFIKSINASSLVNISSFLGYASIKRLPSLNTSTVTTANYSFFSCVNIRQYPTLDLSNCQYLTGTFQDNKALVSIPFTDISKATQTNYLLASVRNYFSISSLNLNAATNMSSMFSESGISSITELLTPQVTNISSMLSYCYGLNDVPAFNTNSVVNMDSIFAGNSRLRRIPALNLASAADPGYGNQKIVPAPFAQGISRIQAFGFTDNVFFEEHSLSANAINELFTNLGTVTSKTIFITGNYGAPYANVSIATNKGWTVVG